jgi:TolA-binding protein
MSKKLEHNALPNLEEMKRYSEGKLSRERMREIENIANENPLLKESLEGYATTGIFMAMPAFESTALASMGSASSGAAAAGTSVSTKITVATIVAVASGSVYYATHADKPAENAIAQPTELPSGDHNVQADATQWNEAAQGNLEQGNPEVGSAGAVHHTAEATNQANAQTFSPSTDGALVAADGSESGSASYIPPMAKTELPAVLPEKQLKNKSALVGVGMSEILNYRVADYSDHRALNWNNHVFSEGHTPANLESKGQKVEVVQKNGMTYMQYLEECIRYYDRGQFKQAQEGFSALGKLYSDDVNAQFYGAMTHYKSGQYAQAIEMFATTESNVLRSFRDEARFYRAMSLKEVNRTQEANALFQEIASGQGFYAKRAQTELID